MMAQADLARAFANGATEERASSVEIRDIEGGQAIVDTRGKGAVLAYRYPSGHIVGFEGWYGYSSSTSCMMSKMGILGSRADEVADAKPVTSLHRGGVYLGDWLESHSPDYE